MTLKNLIKNKQRTRKHFTWNGVEVFVKDEIENPEISIHQVLEVIAKKVSKSFFQNIDIIYIGDFEILKNREIQAMYENSCIFVTNKQSDIDDMCEDIVHEVAHSLEEIYKEEIYSDGKLEEEFIEKRKQLFSVLKSENVPANLHLFLKTSYNQDFDDFLYKEVGYPLLNMLGANIYYSPYAATSLREYFANGFEALFYHGEYDFINKVCPNLFSKLNNIMEITND